MEVTKRLINSRMLKVDDQEFERMREFALMEDNNITFEITRRIVMAN
jgi:hypothetical protein